MLSGFLVALSGQAAVTFDDLQSATKTAFEDFTTRNPSHVEHFTGFKTWKSGNDGKVKIYVDHGGMNMEFNYTCIREAEVISCHSN